jgi:plastocyanin
VIIVAENGFEPAYLVAQPGDVVQFVNMDTDGHTATAAKAETAAAAVGGIYFDSGLLLAGEKYTFQLTAAGSYRFVDNASPANRGTLVVSAAPAAAAFAVYLPITGR